MLRHLLLLLLPLLLPVVAAATALPEKLPVDFAPLDGVIVLAAPGQILIDRDGASGVVVGDLFAVVTPGVPIIHPTSGAVLGSSQSVSGWLRVAGVRSGYSEATLLPESAPPAVGAKISRFAEAEALFIDAPGSAADLYPQLQTALPHLRWLGYFTTAPSLPAPTLTPRLLFTAANNALEVREERSGLLRRYPLATPPPPRRGTCRRRRQAAVTGTARRKKERRVVWKLPTSTAMGATRRSPLLCMASKSGALAAKNTKNLLKSSSASVPACSASMLLTAMATARWNSG